MMRKREIVQVAGLVTGFLGVVLLAVAFTSSGMSYNPDGWPLAVLQAVGSKIPRNPQAAALSFVGLVLLCFGWWLVRPRPGQGRGWLGVVAVAWITPMLFGPPFMSGDAFLYADAAWIVGQGVDAYQTGLCALPGPYSASVDVLWCGKGVPYPPLAIWASWLAAAVTGFHPYWGVVAQRGLALIGWGLTAALLPRLAGRLGVDSRWAWWVALLNPVVLFHGIGGAHSDLLMTGLVVAALAVAGPGRGLIIGSVLVGLAMGIKPQAGLAVLGVGGLSVVGLASLPKLRAGGKMVVSVALATILALVTFVVTSLVSGLGFGWTQALGMPSSVITISPFFLVNDVVQHGQVALGFAATPYASWIYYLVLVAGAIAFLGLGWRFVREPVTLLAWGSLVVVLVSKGLHMWYFILPAVLFGLVRLSSRTVRWLSFGAATYLFAYLIRFMYGWSIWADLIGGLIMATILLLVTRAEVGAPTAAMGRSAETLPDALIPRLADD